MSNTTKEVIQDRFLEAVKLMTDKAVASLSYDRTIEAMVVSTERKTEGIYIVTYDQYTFEAYARSGESYYENDVVLVQVPQNDFKNQKYIIGRKDSQEATSKAYNFKFPFDDFVAFNQIDSSFELIDMKYQANNPQHGNELIDKNGSDRLVWAYENNGNNTLFGTKIGIKVDVQTLLASENVKEGNFGLQIIIKGLYVEGDGAADQNTVQSIYFTEKNMYGNPYAYLAPSEQQLIIDVAKYKRIDAIYIAFWQKFTQDSILFKGSFKNSWGQLIPYEHEELNTTGISIMPENIILSNLQVYSGVSLDEVGKDTLFVYTYDDLTYGQQTSLPNERVYYDRRTLHAAWVKYDDSKHATLVNSQDKIYLQDAHLYWYVHDSSWTPDAPTYNETNPAHRFGGLFWRPLSECTDKTPIDVVPDITHSNERYKAVIHYDGTYLTSDTIRFNNALDVEGMAEDLARNDAYILKCATYKKDPELNAETLVADDAIGNFFVYDENNNILTSDDNKLYSDIIYYIEIWAKTTTETGETSYVRLSDYTDDNGDCAPYTVEWTCPTLQTMISRFRPIEVGEAYFSQRSDDQFARDFTSTRAFQISRLYNMRYNNNDIIAKIQRNGQTFTIKKSLSFGRAAALGCEYTPVINIDTPEGNYYIDTNSTYSISCLVYDRRGQLIEESARPQCTFEWKFYGGRNKPAHYYLENRDGFAGNVITGRQSVCEPFVIEVTVHNAGDYPLTVRRGIMICNNSLFMHEHDVQCPDRIEFRSDGQSPKYYHNTFSIQTLNLGELNKYLYPTWMINNTKFLKLNSEEQNNQTYVSSTGETIGSGGTHTVYSLGFAGHKVHGTAIDNDNYSQQWTDQLLSDDYFTYIYCTYGTTMLAQAIAFDKNEYASSLVNEWDGQSLSLDEENGAVIAKMIAAGSKDKKNRFTGVMMGDWHEKGDESLDMTGLYGFQSGSQTFAFKQDGTGFIGPSGKGRIHFDGRNALISNSDKSCYLNLNPVMVEKYMNEQDEEIWDLSEESGFSQYFLYCKVPQKVESDNPWKIIGVENISAGLDTQQRTWANRFINPPEDSEEAGYDFFLVDPNNGVVTSGGIYARYGVIGKNYPWIISDTGLTQKNNFGIIYLGNPEENPVKWPTPVYEYDKSDPFNDPKEVGFSIAGSHISSPTSATFGVTSDGQLYARKGHLGLRSAWHIGDDGLYAEIGNNAVYMGNPNIDYSYHKMPDSYIGTQWAESQTNGFMISAGGKSPRYISTNEIIKEDKSPAVFGVRPDGFLYSESGLIAGWAIEPGSLTKYAEDNIHYLIKLDSENAQIAMMNYHPELESNSPNKELPEILLDASTTIAKAQIGLFQSNAEITLAGYQIKSDTSTTSLGSLTITAGNLSDTTTINLGSVFSVTGGGTSSEGETGKWSSSLFLQDSVMPENITIDTMNMISPDYFAILHPKENDAKTPGLEIITSSESDSVLLQPQGTGLLGSPNTRWKIYGNESHFTRVFGEEMLVYDAPTPIDGETETKKAVAGFYPVASKEYVNYRFTELGNYVVKLNEETYNAFTWTRNRVNQIWAALTGGKDQQGNIQSQIQRLQAAIVNISDATFTGSGADMSTTVNYSTIGGSGSFKLNFNIADTEYFKTYALHSYSVGGNSDGAGVATSVPTSNSKQVGTTLVILNKKEESMVDKTIIIDATSAYEAGWADAIATLAISVDTTSGTVTATVGDETAGSNTKSTTYTLGADGTSHSGTWYSGITAIAPGVWNSTGEISNPYTSIYGTISWS